MGLETESKAKTMHDIEHTETSSGKSHIVSILNPFHSVTHQNVPQSSELIHNYTSIWRSSDHVPRRIDPYVYELLRLYNSKMLNIH